MRRILVVLTVVAMLVAACAVPAFAQANLPQQQDNLAECAAAGFDPLDPSCWAMSQNAIQDWTSPQQAG